MSPEELNEIINRPQPPKEFRLYYDDEGKITMFAESSHPEGNNYIVLTDPGEFHCTNTLLLRVKDGKLIKIDPVVKSKPGLQRSNKGQRVVKGIAALMLLPTEEYTDVEYYDLKTNC
jgi:hypothetical protein